MKLQYGDIVTQSGAHTGVICKLEIIPREWLSSDVVISHTTGNVVSLPTPFPGRSFFTLHVIPESLKFLQKPAISKAGPMYSTTINGRTNLITPLQRQTLETLRHHELLAVVTFGDGRRRVVGSKYEGLKFSFEELTDNNGGGRYEAALDFFGEFENTSPFIRS
ncbi:MAG TPA: hypothetical protein PKY29_04505 [Ferruginibacter sp.]|nr:hypothetical protein [Ferruginibacter sp.]HRQ20550.1 hypothetical protein [Ferruginibacter sp.]